LGVCLILLAAWDMWRAIEYLLSRDADKDDD
jgi:hypothetical protein